MNALRILGVMALAGLLSVNVMASEVGILAEGSSLHSANGFSFDGKDRLYVASGPGSQLVVMDEHGKVLDRFDNADGVQSVIYRIKR